MTISLQKRVDDRVKRGLRAIRLVEHERRVLMAVFVEPRVIVRESPGLDALAQRVLEALRHDLPIHVPLRLKLRGCAGCTQ